MKTRLLYLTIILLSFCKSSIAMELTRTSQEAQDQNLIRAWGKIIKTIAPGLSKLKVVKTEDSSVIKSWLDDEHMQKMFEQIVELNISSCELTAMPIPLQLFPNLKKLNLSNNQLISIEIPETLTNLECLWLDENQLRSVAIPSTLKNLKVLVIGENELVSIKIPDTLAKLERLYLRYNKLRSLEIPDTLTNLRWLYIGGNNLEYLIISPNIRTNLEVLCQQDLDDFKLERAYTFGQAPLEPDEECCHSWEDISEDSYAKTNENLMAAWPRVQSAITEILGMPPVVIGKSGTVLDDEGKPLVISTPEEIAAWMCSEQNQVILDQITELDFSSCGLTSLPLDLSLFKNLKQLSLSDNKLVSIEIPDTLTNLNWINLSNNRLPSLQLPESLINLEELSIDHNQLTSLKVPTTYSKLKRLQLNHNKLTAVRIPGTLTNLEYLFLNDNKLDILKIPASLTSLKRLRIQNNKFKSITIPESIKSRAKISGPTKM